MSYFIGINFLQHLGIFENGILIDAERVVSLGTAQEELESSLTEEELHSLELDYEL